MAKNIVICSDGTGNAFAKGVSNVTRLIQSIALDRPATQIAFYDQGIGTDPGLIQAVKDYANESGPNRKALAILREPGKPAWMPAKVALLVGLAVGYGLRDNMMQMYQSLCKHWCDGDKVFLVGFSRGAFTLRALAGLIYRCGLVRQDVADSESYPTVFAKAFDLYEPYDKNIAAIERFKKQYCVVNECAIDFLGLWDTVKSYGGIWPVSLPHLRHNPIVRTVRHALALHEKRSWFIPTSWGGIDTDDPVRLGVEPHPGYAMQNVKEIWFRGCHSDVGGGDVEAQSATIPLHWMLREAYEKGLLLNDGVIEMLKLAESSEGATLPEIHESLNAAWLVTEYFPPRWELNNSTRPAKRFLKVGRSGARHIEQFARGGKVYVHASAAQDYPLRSVEIELSGSCKP